jgi:hypothetical protein
MNKSLGVLLLLAGITPALPLVGDCACKNTSHTFFSVRPQYQSASPERVSLFHNPEQHDNGWGAAIELAFFGGRSTNNQGLAKFFMPFCKTTLQVDEDPNADTDLVAQNFGIDTVNGINPLATAPAFSSTFRINPRQSTFGIGFTYRQDFPWLASFWDCGNNLWFEISTPLTRVANRVDIIENVINDGGGAATGVVGLPSDQTPVANMTEAFNQSSWLYGKIETGKTHTKWGLADIEAKIGWEWPRTEVCSVEAYVGVVIPTGTKPHAVWVFEPIVGNNRHFGIMSGGSAHFKLWGNDCWTLACDIDSDCRYLFSRNERRSFDLKYRPWSRYLEIYSDISQAQQAANLNTAGNLVAANLLDSPGINLFTQELKVKPRFISTSNIALTLARSCYDLEVGYNIFFRQAECVKFAKPFPTGAAVKASVGQGRTNSLRTINNNLNALNDTVFSVANYTNAIIQQSDIDLESASHPAVLAYTIYAALGYRMEDYCNPMFAGLGGSYEFGDDNVVLKRWNIWGKWGISF